MIIDKNSQIWLARAHCYYDLRHHILSSFTRISEPFDSSFHLNTGMFPPRAGWLQMLAQSRMLEMLIRLRLCLQLGISSSSMKCTWSTFLLFHNLLQATLALAASDGATSQSVSSRRAVGPLAQKGTSDTWTCRNHARLPYWSLRIVPSNSWSHIVEAIVEAINWPQNFLGRALKIDFLIANR